MKTIQTTVIDDKGVHHSDTVVTVMEGNDYLELIKVLKAGNSVDQSVVKHFEALEDKLRLLQAELNLLKTFMGIGEIRP